jgi:hypothetical protein
VWKEYLDHGILKLGGMKLRKSILPPGNRGSKLASFLPSIYTWLLKRMTDHPRIRISEPRWNHQSESSAHRHPHMYTRLLTSVGWYIRKSCTPQAVKSHSIQYYFYCNSPSILCAYFVYKYIVWYYGNNTPRPMKNIKFSRFVNPFPCKTPWVPEGAPRRHAARAIKSQWSSQLTRAHVINTHADFLKQKTL